MSLRSPVRLHLRHLPGWPCAIALALACKPPAPPPAPAPPPPAPALDLTGAEAPTDALWLDALDLRHMTTGFGRAAARKTITGNPLRIAGVTYPRGVGTHADSELAVRVDGQARWFLADVGVDDELSCIDTGGNDAATRFAVLLDGKLGGELVVRKGEPAQRLAVPLDGVTEVRLRATRESSRFNHVNWAGALFLMNPGTTGAVRAISPGPEAIGKPQPPLPEGWTGRLDAADEELLLGLREAPGALRIGSLDWSLATGDPVSTDKTAAGEPLRLGTRVYPHGVAVAGESTLVVDVANTGARRFIARVGLNEDLDCAKALSGGGARFLVWADDRRVFDSGTVHGYDPAVDVDVDLTGVGRLVLDARLEGATTRLVWAGGLILRDAAAPAAAVRPSRASKTAPLPRAIRFEGGVPLAIAPARLDEPGIHGPRVVGTTPGRPFLFRVPATGKAPRRFAARGLPDGLILDTTTGIITGAVARPGDHEVELTVTSAGKTVARTLFILAGEELLARTPPMGWNSWNVWGLDVDDGKIRAAAQALVTSGLASFGYQHVNIDDAWEGERDARGVLQPNPKFPDMKALGDFVHGLGLKFGIYTSPGPTTCGNYAGSYQHEAQDARTFAGWGVDYVKHDWCSYGAIVKENTREAAMAPYRLMAEALRATGRDILLSICQYGAHEVWEWGKEVGGHLWRTTGDIVDTWNSVESIGFSQAEITRFGGPGGWNDPDMLVVGHLGWSANLHPTRLTPNEQITHLSLWSLLAAPLLLGADLTRLDDFTRALLMNPEVIDVDQDPAGFPARRLSEDHGAEVWARALHDGTVAVGLFNRSPIEKVVSTRAAQLQLVQAELDAAARLPVRDLWRRKDDPPLAPGAALARPVPPHGARLLRVGTPNPARWRPASDR